jgi:DNA-binding response OmpR family regulator
MDTILIVDDEDEARLLIQEHLKNEDYRFLEARDGVEAQEIIASRHSDISAVILDWKMPRLDGIDVLRWVKHEAAYESIPIIMHTGMGEAKNIHEGIEAGAFYYLMKSAQHELLLSVVRTAVSEYRNKRSLMKRLEQEGNPYHLLIEGTFRFRTLEEAEFLALRIAKACSMPDAVVGISELLANAVEHGNLNITYNEKSELVTQGLLAQTIQERLGLPEHAAKFVEVKMSRHREGTTMHIKDQGPGFDFTAYMTFDESRAFDNHGRGIAIARTMLNIQYLGNGNEVLVTIPSTN